MADDNCDERIDLARKQGFRAGRRAGLWLAFNGPQAKAKARGLDVRAMRRQDVALEGLGDVFGRAEQEASERDRRRAVLNRIPRPRYVVERAPAPVFAQEVFQAPAPAPAPPIQRLPSRRELIFELRQSDAPALRERLRGISAQEIFDYYKTQPPQRDTMRDLATRLGVKHRAAGESTVMDARRLSQALARHLS